MRYFRTPGTFRASSTKAGRDASARPGPIFLSQSEQGQVLPILEIGGTLHADPIVRRVEEQIVTMLYDHTGVLARTG